MRNCLLITITTLLSMACGRVEGIVPDESDFTIRFYTGIDYTTKSKDPEETYIHDINLFIFDDKGNLEDARFIDSDKLTMTDKGAETSFRWIKDKSCMAYACANFGYKITGIENLGDLMSYRYHMAYPDEYSRGIPMSGKAKKDKASKSLTIPLTRMMAKISMNIDRTALAAGVQYSVRSVRIGGSPKSALAFGQSKATGNTDIFSGGFSKSFTETYNLNIDKKPGISEEISLYMLENMQGDLLPKAKDEKDKILESSDALSEVCSYIEIKAEYRSESMYSRPDEYMTDLKDKPVTITGLKKILGVTWTADRATAESKAEKTTFVEKTEDEIRFQVANAVELLWDNIAKIDRLTTKYGLDLTQCIRHYIDGDGVNAKVTLVNKGTQYLLDKQLKALQAKAEKEKAAKEKAQQEAKDKAAKAIADMQAAGLSSDEIKSMLGL